MDVYTGYLVRQHMWRVMVVALLIVAVVTPIHVASSVGLTLQQALEQGRSGPWELARFVAFRAADVLSQVFPISLILGVLWSETAHSLSGRRLMALVAGRSLAAEIRALLLVAAGSVAFQFVLDNVVRPHVVLTMIEERVGNYMDYFASAEMRLGIWLTTGDTVLQARGVDRGVPALHDVTLYRFGPTNALEEIAVAQTLRPLNGSGGSSWRMESGYRVAITEPRTSAGPGMAPQPSTTHFSGHEVALGIDPLWVRYLGIAPGYVRLGDLARLASSSGIPLDQPDYAAGLQQRLSRAVTAGLLCTLATVTFLLGGRRRHVAIAAGMALFVTYLGIAASNAIGALGQSRYLAGPAGVWLAPLLLLLLAGLSLWGLSRATRMPHLAPATPRPEQVLRNGAAREVYAARRAAARQTP